MFDIFRSCVFLLKALVRNYGQWANQQALNQLRKAGFRLAELLRASPYAFRPLLSIHGGPSPISTRVRALLASSMISVVHWAGQVSGSPEVCHAVGGLLMMVLA